MGSEPTRAPAAGAAFRRPLRAAAQAILPVLWSLQPERLSNRIIYYHSVHPTLERSHRPEDFSSQLDWLDDNGFRTVKMSDVPELLKSQGDEPWVAITFDDGYADNLEYAAPILQSRGMSATVFTIAGMVGDVEPIDSDLGHKLFAGRPMLTRADLRELARAGFEVASHGYLHQSAATMARKSPAVYLDDLIRSRALLEDAVGTAVTSYAYPNGQKNAFSSATRELLPQAGFHAAATTIWGPTKATSDPLELPRCEVSASDSIDEFIAKMTGRREYRRIYQRMVDRSRAW